MPTNQPSSAPQNEAPRPTDDLSAAAVLHDDALDQPAGGGGLGTGAGLGGDAAGRTGAASPNSPIAADLPHEGGDRQAEAEARLLATAGNPPETGHMSQ